MRVENLEKCIAKKVLSINTVDELEKLLEFWGRGNMYMFSAENLIAIYAQNPEATIVSSFDVWKQHGRYPLQNTGIAVYPYNTTGVFGKFTDYLFDVKGTSGQREGKFWSSTDDILESYIKTRDNEYTKTDEKNDIQTYFNSTFYESTLKTILYEHTELLFETEEMEKRFRIHKFITNCITKVFLTRCGIEYVLSENTKDIFKQYLINDEGAVNAPLLMKCMRVMQETITQELVLLSNYVIKEKRKRKDEQGNNIEKSNANSGERSDESDRSKDKGVDDKRGGSIEATRSGESRDIPGIRENVEQKIGMGKDGSEISEGTVSGTASSFDGNRTVGTNNRQQSTGSTANVRNTSYAASGKGQGSSDGNLTSYSSRESDPSGDNGNNQQGSAISSDSILEPGETFGESENQQIYLYITKRKYKFEF